MQVSETKNEGLSREFTVTVGADEIDQKVEAKLVEVGQTMKLPGFRPGKVPMKILRQRFGNAVLGEVLEAAVGETSQSVLTERALKPAMQPKIEISSFDPGADLVYTMGVEIMPEIEPVDFSTLTLNRYKPEIADEEVENALGELAKNNRATQKIEKDRKTKSGDVVVMDFKGFVDGEAFQGGEATDFRLELGSGQFIPGFEDQLIGQSAGEDIKVQVKFPEEYGAANLAGKDAVFECKISEIHEYTERQLDDEFAKELGLESLDDLRGQMRSRIEGEYAELARARTKRELLDVLFEKHDFEVPAGMVDSEFEQIWEQFAKAREQGNVDEDDKEKDDEVLKSEYRDIAKRRVLLGLLLSHVGDTANVQVTQEELQRAVFEQARRYPGQEQQVFEHFTKNPEMMASLRAPIFEEKTVDYILELAQVTDVSLPVDKLLETDDSDEGASADKGKAKKAAKKSASKKASAKKAAAKKSDD
ncbi:MAG: trigger factor [Alphaproteobacteria bacterium]|jgi:trigger factor|uniref:trigger factor n=1 Tax=Pacificispira sp. TaxID=2888761 RepID=UPI001B2A5A5E|nr:trigger factor [Alphaproteobacteria bacterium]MBO6862155.1 trigger factor [Alphaproteobacteria bacterium]MEC9267741.1 trigger factor [Pseudomonadota bacterium]